MGPIVKFPNANGVYIAFVYHLFQRQEKNGLFGWRKKIQQNIFTVMYEN